MNATPDKPATPLVPVAPALERPYATPQQPPIEGGKLQVIDASAPQKAKAEAARQAAAGTADGVEAAQGSAQARRGRSQPSRFTRSAFALSGLMNLLVFAGLALTAAGRNTLPPAMLGVSVADAAKSAMAADAPRKDIAAAAPSANGPVSGPVSGPVDGPVTGPITGPASGSATTDITAPTVTAAAEPKPAPTAAAPTASPTAAPAGGDAGAPAIAAQTVSAGSVAAPALLAAEAEHVARFDTFIAPARDAPISVEDATRLRDAMAALSSPQQARALRDQLTDPVARKLIDWALARGGNGSAREIKAFIDKNPNWPSQDLLAQRAEEQLFVSGGSVKEIKAFFDKGAPKSAIGLAALASAFLAEGDEAQARQLAGQAWRRSDMPASLETGFLERFGRLLSEDDHKARFDRYMIDNTRWTADRNDRAAVARRVLPLLGEAQRKKAEARLAAYLRQPAADALLTALAADATTAPKADWGLAFQLSQWNRRGGRKDASYKILMEVPTDATVAGNLDEWWEERRLAAYDALKAGKPKIAYDIVKQAGQLSVNQAKDQAFLAGWIALRHLGDAKAAERHFAALESVADGPLSRAKGGYWLARAFEAQKAPEKMRAPLERAARNFDTFYGQLARLELDPKRTDIRVTPPRTPTPEEIRRFNENELVRAAVLSRKSNQDTSVTRALLAKLSLTLETEAEHGLLAHLAEALGDPQMAVRIGKAAIARGLNLTLYAYPINAMPAYQTLRAPPEQALVLGITRQESEFDTTIVSGAGARGLMQVMTVTAQHVCHDYKVKCELERLSSDPGYNAMMATAYIADRMDEFQGSYVLTIAGYNAGPNRVRQWMKEFGDPRTSAVDPIDWINRIPFEETREYVQKVLSNTQIYRARLGNEATALRLNSDLHRTSAADRRSAVTQPPTSAETARN